MNKDVVYTHTHTPTGILVIKKKWNNAICSYMDATRNYHTKQNKSERERQITYITYRWNLKCDTNELIWETDSET